MNKLPRELTEEEKKTLHAKCSTVDAETRQYLLEELGDIQKKFLDTEEGGKQKKVNDKGGNTSLFVKVSDFFSDGLVEATEDGGDE